MSDFFEYTPKIIQLINSISYSLGQIHAQHLDWISQEQKKENRIQTVRATTHLNGVHAPIKLVKSLYERKRIIDVKEDVLAILNTIEAYHHLPTYEPYQVNSILKAHLLMMNGLIEDAGKCKKINDKEFNKASISPKVHLRKTLQAIQHSEDIVLIKSCLIHYQLIQLQLFSKGNARIGRLWQTLILMKKYPVFEYLPFENSLLEVEDSYTEALQHSLQNNQPAYFITYMLSVIYNSLLEFQDKSTNRFTEKERLAYFIQLNNKEEFTRKDYMQVFKEISTATASRDLAKGVYEDLFIKLGAKNKAKYITKI